MGSKLFVGNLSFNTTEESLQALFGGDGRSVVSVKIINDRETGRSRGFGFVEMGSDSDAQSAMDALNDTEIDGRNIRVDVANERPDRGGGGGGGGGGGYGGGGGRGRY